jgi:two-component system phosphate regulon sensor histidine kinase PhoR
MFTLEPINPQQLCVDVVRELTPLFAAHGRRFKVVRSKRRLLLVANRDLLRRIVMSFSENALHYAEGDNALVEINFGLSKSGDTVRLGVRDYGPALAPDVLGSIKGRLASAPTSLYARPSSSGLGIYIASQFAEIMNGRVGVTRHRDGSTFYVDLQASRQLSLL